MLKESRAPAKESPVKAIVAGVLLVGALGFVGWRVYSMFSTSPSTPPGAVQQAETHAEELKKAADELPAPPPPPPPPADRGPPTRAPRSRGAGS